MLAPAVTEARHDKTLSGVGIGLRSDHWQALLAGDVDVPWLELLTDNFLRPTAMSEGILERISDAYPVSLHGVSMNLGGLDPLDHDYIEGVRRLAERTDAVHVSDHLCFTAFAGRQYHELLPMPYTQDAVRHIAARIEQAQDMLGRQLLVENVSAYIRSDTVMDEADFISEICEQADCLLLCDLNNLYVNQINLGDDALEAMSRLPAHRVHEIHLGGYDDRGDHLVDAHNNPVSDPVWALYRAAITHFSDVPVCIEWDNDIPPLASLMDEVQRASDILSRVSQPS